jgi:PAS domain-containing protein
MDETYKYWLATFQHMIGTKKYSQITLVEKIKELDLGIRVTKGHLNAVYKERSGRGNKKIKASLDLQEAIARVYGLNHLEFLHAGQQILSNGNPLEKSSDESGVLDETGPANPLYKEWSVEDLKALSVDGFDQKIEEYTVKVQDGLIQHAGYFINRVRTIAKTRNQTEQERIRLLSIIEASSDAIKVNRADDKVVTYENQAYKRLIGRSLLWKPCPGLCGETGEECYVDEVKVTGHAVHTIRKWNGRWYEIVANPINKDGVLHSVVAVIRDISGHYTKSLESNHNKALLQSLLSLTSDTVSIFDESRQMVGATSHHHVEDVERPTDLNSFILYAGNLFHGITEAYEKLNQVYRDHRECEFDAVNKRSGKTWRFKATPVFDQEEFIGIMITSREVP